MGGGTSRRPQKLIDGGLNFCHAFPAGRVGWRGVEKIHLAGIGSARRRKEVGLQSEVRYPTTGTPHRSSPRLEGSPAIRAGLFLFEQLTPPSPHPLFPIQSLSTSWALPMGRNLPCLSFCLVRRTGRNWSPLVGNYLSVLTPCRTTIMAFPRTRIWTMGSGSACGPPTRLHFRSGITSFPERGAKNGDEQYAIHRRS